jgi:TrmH family RNA methyltransferase
MKNMGAGSLRLVNAVPFTPDDITTIAHRSEDVLAALQHYDTLDAALADVRYVLGTSARPRTTAPTLRTVREVAADLASDTDSSHFPLAVLFGPEDNGLDNAALDRCHAIVHLPTDPSYPSLNLSHAVLLLLYELRMATLAQAAPSPPIPKPAATPPVTGAAYEAFFAIGQEALQSLDFFTSAQQIPHMMRMLRQLTYRARPGEKELALLTAIAREIIKTRARVSQRTNKKS